jgi:segregation and condensation protein A
MDGFDPAWDGWSARVPPSPTLHLDGFDGPMDLLLDLAERQKIDFGRMSVLALAEQFVAAMARFGDRVALERRADWLVMATRLVLLRSRLLFPATLAAAAAAERDAAGELRRIGALAQARAAAGWLGARPVLGQDVFTRGAPEFPGAQLGAAYEVDVVAFLWAGLALFEDGADELDTVMRYRPAWTDLYTMAEARDRIMRILGTGRDEGGGDLGHFLPERLMDDAGDAPERTLRLSSAWATTFSASLELAKQGDVALAQADAFASIHVNRRTKSAA